MFRKKKKTDRSPSDVRRRVTDITGIPVNGVVKLPPPEAPCPAGFETYLIGHNGGVLICMFGEDGDEIAFSADGEKPAQTWTTGASGSPPNDQLHLIKVALNLQSLPIFRTFTHEVAGDIMRRTYDTNIGHVRMSTRRKGQDQTEIVLEALITGRIVRLMQNRHSGAIDLSAMEELGTVPF